MSTVGLARTYSSLKSDDARIPPETALLSYLEDAVRAAEKNGKVPVFYCAHQKHRSIYSGLAWAKKKLIEGADEVVVVLHRHSSTHGGFDGLRKMMGGWGPNPSKPSKDDCVEQHRNISQGLSLDLVQRGPAYYSEALCFEDVEPSLWMDCRHAAGGAEPDDSLEAERSVERPAVAVPDLDIRPPYSTLERMYDIWKCG